MVRPRVESAAAASGGSSLRSAELTLAKELAEEGRLSRPTHAMAPAAPRLCLITRIELTRRFDLLYVLLAFYRMRRRARSVQGLAEVSLFVRRWRTVFIVSLWRDELAMAEFATAVPGHLKMVRRTFRTGARSWSGLFEFFGTSGTSGAWDGASKVDE